MNKAAFLNSPQSRPDDRLDVFLQSRRLGRRISQRALADRAGISGSTLSRWENGSSVPSIPELEAVLQVLRATSAERTKALSLIARPRSFRILSGPAPLVSGSLLRAMRLRSGRTQADVAAQVGVSQSVLAKWEASEAWPSTERLQCLCFELGALPGEVVALTTGRFASPPFGSPIDEIDAVYRWLLIKDDLVDLRFLSLLRFLETRTNLSVGEREMLGQFHIDYAYVLNEGGRAREAKVQAEKSLALESETTTSPRAFGCQIYIAQGLVQSGGKGVRRAIRQLTELLGRPAPNRGFRSWALLDLSNALARDGRIELAWERSEEARRLTKHGNGSPSPEDLLYDAQFHLLVNDATAAMSLLSENTRSFEQRDVWHVRAHLLQGRALISLRQFEDALSHLQIATHLSKLPELAGYRLVARDLTARALVPRDI